MSRYATVPIFGGHSWSRDGSKDNLIRYSYRVWCVKSELVGSEELLLQIGGIQQVVLTQYPSVCVVFPEDKRAC